MNAQRLIRKIHIYTGLFFFLFFLLFAISGFMLNHRWSLWEYWSERKEITVDVEVVVQQKGSDLETARDMLKQLEIDGEIHFLLNDVKRNMLEIKTTRPGMKSTTKIHLDSGRGKVTTIDLNAWEFLPSMHVMSGLHSNIPDKKNWLWTKIWSVLMDLTALALIALLVSGVYMWIQLKAERRIGLLCLELGAVVFFIIFWSMVKF